MSFSPPLLFGIGVSYLLVLFAIAWTVEQGWWPRSLVTHPAIHVLSLGVYATSWSYYGSVGFAQSQGYNFLTIYLGVTFAFLLAPLLLQPILRITREYQLSSLADLFAFRYRSQWVGVLVTLFMLAGTLPYIALQIRAVTESMRVLTQEVAPAELAFVFCLTLTLFAVLFGARHISTREKHEGLVVAIAFESLIKITALLVAGGFALFGLFGGPAGLDRWLDQHPEAVEALYAPVREGSWHTLLLLSFAAAFLLPRQFHMGFAENDSERALSVASWAFPLFLLLLNLAIPPLLWAGTELELPMAADYYVLGVALSSGNHLLPVMVFIGGISAASAMMIVTTLALSAMCLNHLLLPATYPDPQVNLYRWLLWARRVIIAVIIMLGFGFYQLLEHKQGLVQLGLISFVAVAQFLPGVVGLLYWRRATRYGFLAGLSAGALVWYWSLVAPLLHQSVLLSEAARLTSLTGQNTWSFATFWSLLANGLLFVVVSLLTRPTPEEEEAAGACCRETPTLPRGGLSVISATQFRGQLARIIGDEAAEHQVRQALRDLDMEESENRPSELGRLRERIERNLSGLLGPLLANMIVNRDLEQDAGAERALVRNVRFIEQHLEASRTRLRGLAAELDALRRYHRQILQDLPLGVCSIGPDGEIVIWNLAMEMISGVGRNEAVGASLEDLDSPWGEILRRFMEQKDNHLRKQQVKIGDTTRWLNLHKSTIEEPASSDTLHVGGGGTALLVEDLTDLHTLESELAHSERLASIGRLAAGVAHEIGNPVTGIACLAQNLRDDPDEALVRESVEQILEQTRRIGNIVHALVSFSHGGDNEETISRPFLLYYCVEDAVRLVRLSKSGKNIQIVNRCDPDLQVSGDKPKLAQVFVNLLTNACDASPEGGRVEVRAVARGGEAFIEVLDQGCGLPEEIRDRVFEPFFTTKPAGEGTGLGLALAYNIIHEHGGTIGIAPREPRGTRINIRLPLAGGERLSAAIRGEGGAS